MTHSLEFRDGVLRARTSGDIEIYGFLEYLRAVLEHEKWTPGGKLLCDHRELKGFSMNIPNVTHKTGQVANFIKDNEARLGNAAIASILPCMDASPVTSLWITFIEHIKVDINYKNFYDMVHAEQWLSSR